MALFYDMYWLLLAHKRRRRFLSAVQDMLFWLVVFCALSALWLYATGGMMRLAVYLWMGGGALLWYITLHRRLRRLRLPFFPSVALFRQKLASYRLPASIRRGLTWPVAVMFGFGIGFWRGLAWVCSWGKRGLLLRRTRRGEE